MSSGGGSVSKGKVIRERYEATCRGYDELYRAEQYGKYSVALRKVKPEGYVLDAGCGTALLAEYLWYTGALDNIDLYVCVDYSNCMASVAKPRLELICPRPKCLIVMADVQNLPFPSNTFHVVYSFTVLDLVDSLDNALKELIRVSKGPVVVSMLKRLSGKDRLILMGAEILGVTDKDVIFKISKSGGLNVFRQRRS